MLKFFTALILITLLAIPMGVSAQDPWQVTFLNTESKVIYTLNAEGLVSETSFPEMATFAQIQGAKISPDGTYLAFIGGSADETGAITSSYLYTANLAEGTCCTQYSDPLNSVMDNAVLGNFSPDGSQIAVVLFHYNSIYGTETVESLVSTFDVVTGILTGNLGVNSLVAPEGALVQTAQLSTWDEQGIRLVASCLACEGAFEGVYQIWNPATGDLSEPVEPFSYQRTVLSGTTEAYSMEQDAAYPANTTDGMFLPIPNVIKYYPTPDAEGQVIFHDPNNFQLSFGGGWVLNGDAIFFRQTAPTDAYSNGQAYVLYRDGNVLPIDGMATGEYFFAATPEGFITQNFENGSLLHYKIVAGQLDSVTTLIEEMVGFPQVLSAPKMGTPTMTGFTPAVLD